MTFIRQLTALLLITLIAVDIPAQTLRGNVKLSGRISLSSTAAAPSNLFAALPTSWVNSGVTTGTGFCSTTFDATKTMPGDYAATFAGLIQAKTDQAVANQNWLLVIAAGSNVHGSTYDINNALLSWPVTTYVAGKCLTLRSSLHNTDGQIVCAHGLPGYGGTRDPLCSTDAAKFWKFTIDSIPASGNIGMYFPLGSNNIIVEDMEIAPAPGAAQSLAGVKVAIQAQVAGANHIGFAYDWIHGWNAGDPGQPVGACSLWTKSGIVNTSGTTVTWVSNIVGTKETSTRFGMEVSDGTHSGSGWPTATVVNIAGTNYTVANHDPAASDTTFTLAASAGTQTGVSISFTSPRLGYENGCGDDSRGIQTNGTNVFVGYSQFNKIHWIDNESHAISSGFSAGPTKYFMNWIEAGSSGLFSGGAPVDTRGGPAQDVEIGPSFIGRDLDWKYLSAASGNSPAPPWGCGPLDGNSAHDTCTFNWAIKNNVELKECNRCVLWGVILDGSWADGQSGSLLLLNVRTSGGGQTSGIYDANAGTPLTLTQNIRIENFWFRNSPQVIEVSSRSLGAGNGGGLSQPIKGVEFINGVISNVGDNNQWGASGTDLMQWPGSGQKYLASVTRDGSTATATLAALKIANFDPGGPVNVGTYRNSLDISNITRAGCPGACVVTMKFSGDRHDPNVGGSVVVAAATGWNGTFTISGVAQGTSTTACSQDHFGGAVPAAQATQPQPCVRADGTFGDTITYSDSQGGTASNGTLCSSIATCKANANVTLDTLAFKIGDIATGDGVYVHDCVDSTFNKGATTINLAAAPTSASTLTVYWADTGTPATTTCQIENSQGWPSQASFQHVTVLSLKPMTIASNGFSSQHIDNHIFGNIFAMPSGTNAVLSCADTGGQGTPTFACWDTTRGASSTFQFYSNTILDPAGTRSAQWSVFPAGMASNSFPTTVSCTGATPTSTCLGFSGYMSGASFPTAACTAASAPYGCPLMAAPWSSTFDLGKLAPVNGSSYAGQGANLQDIVNAYSATQYTCPAGASCGTGPYPF